MEIKEQIEGCINNNMVSQSYVFEHNSRKLMAICIRYFYDKDDAEDALSETFVLIFRKIKQYRGGFNEKIFYGWMKRITINVCLTKIRNNRFESLKDSIENRDFVYDGENVYDSFAAKDLLKMIKSLPTGFRTVFNLFAIEGYTHKEIGEMLGISEGTSKSQYSRARNYLREELKKVGITSSLVVA